MTFKDYAMNEVSKAFPEYKFTGQVLGRGLGHVAYTRGNTPALVFPEASSQAVSKHIHESISGIFNKLQKDEGIF
ncbi:hypothetical protein HN747_00205 [archaeon]|jgi:hypothetical protein|nr:hypothetical protein [archaeon]